MMRKVYVGKKAFSSASRIEKQTSRIEKQTSRIEKQTSRIENQTNRIENQTGNNNELFIGEIPVKQQQQQQQQPQLCIREELLALVDPKHADPKSAVYHYGLKRKIAKDCAEMAGYFSSKDNNNNNNQVEEKLEEYKLRVSECQTIQKLLSFGKELAIQACASGDIHTLRTILKKDRGSKNIRQESGESLLHICCQSGHYELAKLCLWYGVDIHLKTNSSKETALHYATFGGHRDIVDLLIHYGCSTSNLVQSRNEYGETALFYCARKGYSSIATQLIYCGCDCNVTDRFGDSALDQAKSKKLEKQIKLHNRLAKLYFDYGVKPTWCCLPKKILCLIYEFVDDHTVQKSCRSVCVNWNIQIFSTIQKIMEVNDRNDNNHRPMTSPLTLSNKEIFIHNRPLSSRK